MANIIINGDQFSGKSIKVVNNKVYVDGKDITPDAKEIKIYVEGSVNQLHVDSCEYLVVDGDANTVSSTSGNITVNEVKGNIKSTSGDVIIYGSCGSVNTVSGDVKAGTINGSTSTVSGDIKNGKIPSPPIPPRDRKVDNDAYDLPF
jgi:hypothetical protein